MIKSKIIVAAMLVLALSALLLSDSFSGGGGGGGGGSLTCGTTTCTSGSTVIGPIFKLTPPGLLATYTQVNGTGTTYSDVAGGGINISSPSNSGANSMRLLAKNLPAAPYTLTFLYVHSMIVTNVYWHVGWYNSSTQAAVTCTILTNTTGTATTTNYRVMQWTTPTTFSSDAVAATSVNPDFATYVILQLKDDGTNRSCSLSNDGLNFTQIYSATNTTFTTPNQYVFGIDPSTNPAQMLLLSVQ